jgi:hypothetical protein
MLQTTFGTVLIYNKIDAVAGFAAVMCCFMAAGSLSAAIGIAPGYYVVYTAPDGTQYREWHGWTTPMRRGRY